MDHIAEAIEPTRDEVIRALIDSLHDLVPVDVEITEHTNIIDLNAQFDFIDSLGFCEWYETLDDRLPLDITLAEMSEYFSRPFRETSDHVWRPELDPRFTVGAFAGFILDRCHVISFEPVCVLGSEPCPAAGYFLGMSQLVQRIAPDTDRFGPSTPICDVLTNNQVEEFWRRLRRLQRSPLPQLRRCVARTSNTLLWIATLLLLFGVLVDWAFLAVIWMLCLKVISFGLWIRRRINVLPSGIITFGDLARHQTRRRPLLNAS